MGARHVLSLITLASFGCYFFSSRRTRQSYLRFILCMLPFIDLQVTTTGYGAFTVFDAASYTAFLFLSRLDHYREPQPANLLLFVLLSMQLLLGCLLSEFQLPSSLYLVKIMSAFIYAKMLADECAEDPAFVESVVKILKFNCLLSVLFLLAQLSLGLDFTFYNHVNDNSQDSYITRYPSFFHDPQMYAQFLAVTSFVFLLHLANSTWVDLAAFTILLFCMLLTGGRAALLGMCAGAVLVFCSGKKRHFASIAGLCLAGCLAAVYFRDRFSMFNRLEKVGDAYQVRHQIWNEAYGIFQRFPLLGIGAGNYQNYVDAHGLGTYYVVNGEILNCGTESGYLKILVETGITGFTLVLSFVLLPIVNAFWRRNPADGIPADGIPSSNRVCLLASIISWLVSFTTLYSFMDTRILVVVVTMLVLLPAVSEKALLKRAV